jgi:hypothetical protein
MAQGIVVRFARILACFNSRVRPTDLRSCIGLACLVGSAPVGVRHAFDRFNPGSVHKVPRITGKQMDVIGRS